MKKLPLEYGEEFKLIISDILENETVNQMKDYRQHYDTSCYEHCKNVAFCSYIICKKLKLDYKSTARSAMLHDFFLYNWRESQENKFHGFTHPRIALNNSMKIFNLNDKEQDIILKHMWPITVILPKYKEGYIVSTVDKICAIQESFQHYKKMFLCKKFFRYAYMFASIILLSI